MDLHDLARRPTAAFPPIAADPAGPDYFAVVFRCSCGDFYGTGGTSVEDAAADVPDGWLVDVGANTVVCDRCVA